MTAHATREEGDSIVAVEGLAVWHGPVPAVRSLDLTVRRSEILTLLGPSGCGKTTTLRAIAGLEAPRGGRIAIDGRTVFDAGRGVNLPPEKRGLSMVFQSYAIWPHLTVFENVAFGFRARGIGGDRVREAVRRSLALVGLDALAERPATRLSGGQQQRVALARAIACDPGVILLDEPLSNLDAQLRLAMRAELKELQRKLSLTAIYVTHDQEEALVLSDRILVMRQGEVEQAGAPAEIREAPASRFVAEFMGVRNIFPCMVAGGQGGRPVAMLTGGVRLETRAAATSTGPTFVCFRPTSVRLFAAANGGGYPGTLVRRALLGDLMQSVVRSGELEICAHHFPGDGLSEGDSVRWSVAPDACFLVRA
ncbi:MAG TPA: ABC transporter ATP-binding protein [Alphaproteobacteria bacterium]|nr:ABC transporter ATP-binding protein [Alphaproteobacteria bacterium]